MNDSPKRALRAGVAAIAALGVIVFVALPCLRTLPADPLDRYLLAAWAIVSIFVAAFGAVLIALDGRGVSVGFGLFCLFSTGPNFVAQHDLHAFAGVTYAAITATMTIAYDLGAIGFAMFALRFPDNVVTGWRRAISHGLPYAIGAFVVLDIANAAIALSGGNDLLDNLLEYALYAAIFVVSAVAIVRSYQRSSGTERARLQWVVVGAAIGYAALIFYNLGYYWNSLEVQCIAGICEIVIPLMFGYAILRHRVLDIVIVVNRAAVYAIVTTVLVSGIALIHWFVGKELEKTHLQGIFEMLAAVGLGLGLNRVHGWVERLIEPMFFRRGTTWHSMALARTAARVDRELASVEGAQALRSRVAESLREIDAAEGLNRTGVRLEALEKVDP
jgi:hypothetical protein